MRRVVIKESVPLPKRAAARRGHGRTTRCPHRALGRCSRQSALPERCWPVAPAAARWALAGHVAGGMSRGDLGEGGGNLWGQPGNAERAGQVVSASVRAWCPTPLCPPRGRLTAVVPVRMSLVSWAAVTSRARTQDVRAGLSVGGAASLGSDVALNRACVRCWSSA